MKSVDEKTRKGDLYFLLFVFFSLMLISLPYVYAEYFAGGNYKFGGFLVNPLDGNSYLAKMYEGWRGEWKFTLPYTADKGEGTYLFLFYILLGHIARIISIDRIILFHIARMLSALFLFFMLFKFFRSLRISALRQKWVLFLALVGSGLGWMLFLFGVVTSDFWVAEAYPFLSAYTNPHFCLGLALVLWIFTEPSMERAEDTLDFKKIFFKQWYIFVLAVILSILSPFGIILVLVVFGGLIVWYGFPVVSRFVKGNEDMGITRYLSESGWEIQWIVVRAVLTFLGGIPMLLYYYWVSHRDPLLMGWNIQNVTSSPPIWDLIISLSPFIIFAIPLFSKFQKQKDYGTRLLVAWGGLSLLLLYIPFSLQRRFMMGIFIPFLGLAVIAVDYLMKQDIFRGRTKSIVTIVILLALPTNVLILFGSLQAVKLHVPMLYLTRDEYHALGWLEQSTEEDALVIASPETSMFIPAQTGRRVLYGHPFETVNAEEERTAQISFFSSSNNSSSDCPIVVNGHQVDYVFYGPRERELGNSVEMMGLTPSYQNGSVEILSCQGD